MELCQCHKFSFMYADGALWRTGAFWRTSRHNNSPDGFSFVCHVWFWHMTQFLTSAMQGMVQYTNNSQALLCNALWIQSMATSGSCSFYGCCCFEERRLAS